MTWEDIIKRENPTKEGFDLLDELNEGMNKGTLTIEEANELVSRIMRLMDRSTILRDYLNHPDNKYESPLWYATMVYEDKTPLEESI
tara:strand:+ start:15228 stop:15488 length:261 start_codon:yes stop_codon:yes gene_type:complete